MTEFLDEIGAALEKFSEEARRVYTRRDLWNQTTKKTIDDALQEILKSCKMPDRKLIVDVGAKYENFGLVQLRFGTIPSGLSLTTAKGFDHGVSRGAVLVFGQSELGEIGITRYPFISSLPGEQREEDRVYYHMGIFQPEDVTRDFVLKQAKDFIDWAAQQFSTRPNELTNDRDDPDRQLRRKQSIGFLPPPIESKDNE